MQNDKLLSYINGLETSKLKVLAANCGTTIGYLRLVAYGVQACREKLAALLEQHCQGKVTRRDLRPDDWHLIWPELAATSSAPAVLSPPPSAREAA